jgi:hypothetical protein
LPTDFPTRILYAFLIPPTRRYKMQMLLSSQLLKETFSIW